MRLHELAKRHGYNQQDLLTAVQKQGFDVKDTLTDVGDDLEKWVAGKAEEGWIPPPPTKKKAAKKKKIVIAVPSGADKPESDESTPESADAATKVMPLPEPPVKVKHTEVKKSGARAATKAQDKADPETVPEAKGEPEVSGPATASEPESVQQPAAASDTVAPAQAASPDSQKEQAGDDKGEKPQTEPAGTEPEKEEPPVVIKRVNTQIRGSAVVGQASPEMIAAIKRSAAASQTQGDRRSRGGARPAAGAKAPVGGSAARAPKPKLEPIMPDADLTAVRPAKARGKSRSRADIEAEERESVEKKARQSKKLRGQDEDWGIDDGDDYVEVHDETPAQDDSGDTQIDSSLIAKGDAAERTGAGVKHKRADFKSKALQHQLPASFAEIDNEFTRSIAGGGGRRRGGRKGGRRIVGRRSRRNTQPIPRVVGQEATVRLGMTIRDVSVALGVKLQEIMSFMMGQGEMPQVNDIMTEEYITLVAGNFKIPLKWETDEDLEEELAQEAQSQEDQGNPEATLERPPVITFMGHVDHGKTSLLDAIRHTRVVAGEHGGITQHIGAYSIVHDGKRVSFLDTPGHEAFSAMRARGANLTDIAVLVVAADDGVMPQTEEAASHAKNAGVPIIVAINKCDLPSANPDRVRQEVANRLELLPEEWGGQVGMIEVSAHTKEGIDRLVERILLEAEVLELRANPTRPATGFVVEAEMSEGQGVLSTLLVTDGTLHNGDVILCSNGYGKIRVMLDEFGQPIEEAGPGMPVRVSGLSAVPEAGDKFFILADLLKARAIAEQRERESRQAALARHQHVTLENLTAHLAGSGKRELSVIVKADVVGTLEVIDKTLNDMATDEVAINIIHSAVGGINHADVILADASDAIILGFHVSVESQARSAASSLGVQIKTYHIIYRMIEDMRAALEGLLPPEEKEVIQGHVEIRQVFRSSKLGAIAGCYVTDGQIQRTNRIRLFRNQVLVYEGTIGSLKRIKDDAKEVKSGFECGIKITNYDAIQEGDVIEAYSIEEIARKL